MGIRDRKPKRVARYVRNLEEKKDMPRRESPEYRKMLKEFSGDYRVLRVVMASDNPIETLHKLRTNQISIITFLDTLEFLDVKATIDAEALREEKEKAKREKAR